VGRTRDQRQEWWLVDVAPGRMLTADDEIQLVAEDAVAVVEDEMEDERRRPQ